MSEENTLDPVGRHFIGLYEKFKVSRTDGRDTPGEKHHGCEYFVLDLTHDPHALPAIRAYAESCSTDPDMRQLGHDLKMAAFAMERNAPAFEQVVSRPTKGVIRQGVLPSLSEVEGKARRLGDSIRGPSQEPAE